MKTTWLRPPTDLANDIAWLVVEITMDVGNKEPEQLHWNKSRKLTGRHSGPIKGKVYLTRRQQTEAKR